MKRYDAILGKTRWIGTCVVVWPLKVRSGVVFRLFFALLAAVWAHPDILPDRRWMAELSLRWVSLNHVEARIAALSDAECLAITACVVFVLLPQPTCCACQARLLWGVEREGPIGGVAMRDYSACQPAAVPILPLAWLSSFSAGLRLNCGNNVITALPDALSCLSRLIEYAPLGGCASNRGPG